MLWPWSGSPISAERPSSSAPPPCFALLGHSADYMRSSLSVLQRIEQWSPAADYHLVLLRTSDAAMLRRSLALRLPRGRTTVHSLDQLPDSVVGHEHGQLVLRGYVHDIAATARGMGRVLLLKLLLPLLPSLKSVERLVFLDSDCFFIEDPRPLFRHFDDFRRGDLLGLAKNHDGVLGVNTGVVLMHLDRMRRGDEWLKLLQKGAAALNTTPRVKLGWLADQTFLSLLAGWQLDRQRLYSPHDAPLRGRVWTLPCGWNRQLSVHCSNADAACDGSANFWAEWASCTEPCRLAHFSGLFFKKVLADVEVQGRIMGNLTRTGCTAVLARHLALPGNRPSADANKHRMLEFVRDDCCSRLS